MRLISQKRPPVASVCGLLLVPGVRIFESTVVAHERCLMMQCFSCGSSFEGSPEFCPVCGSNLGQARVASGKGALEGAPGSPKRTIGRASKFLPLFILVAGLAIYFTYINPSTHSVIQNQPVVAPAVVSDTGFVVMHPVTARDAGDRIAIPLEEVKRYRLVSFEMQTRTTIRPLLAYISPDGRVVTAVSVSEHCGSTEFKIKDNKIYCARCPSNWDMLTMEAYACCGKYYPDPIPSTVEGDEVLIEKTVIEGWAGRL